MAAKIALNSAVGLCGLVLIRDKVVNFSKDKGNFYVVNKVALLGDAMLEKVSNNCNVQIRYSNYLQLSYLLYIIIV